MPIEARGQLTERDHLEALRFMQRRLPGRWAAPSLFLGGPVVLVVLYLLAGTSLQHALIANLFWIVFGLLMFFVGLPRITRQMVRLTTRGNPAATAPQLYRFTEAGFEERECPVEVSIAWSAISEAVETGGVLLLFTGRTAAYLVPRRALAAAGQLEAVQGLLRERLGGRAQLLPESDRPEG